MKKTKTVKDVFAELREIKAEREEFRERSGMLYDQNQTLREEAAEMKQNLTHLTQTVRSLHWALNVACGQLKQLQKTNLEFKFDESKGEWLALAK